MLEERKTLPAQGVRSLCWEGETLVDWVAGGMRSGLDGSVTDRHVNHAYRFDAAQVSPSGRFAVIYERLGTKGLVLREGGILRELNRSYYQAGTYDYPLALFTLPNSESHS